MNDKKRKKKGVAVKNKLIVRAIDLNGGTQDSLAKTIGMSQNTIHKLLSCQTATLSWNVAKKLENAVDGEISKVHFIEAQASLAKMRRDLINKNNKQLAVETLASLSR